MAYTVAVGLRNGTVFIHDYDEDALSHPEILRISEKVYPRVDPACEIPELGTHGLITVAITWLMALGRPVKWRDPRVIRKIRSRRTSWKISSGGAYPMLSPIFPRPT